MSNLPVKHEGGLIARNVQELHQLGSMCANSGFFQDSREAAQAMVKIAAGQELGLAPIQSMTGINVIKNRVTLSANLMAALLKKAGYRWRMVRFDDQVCEMLMFAPDGEELGPSSFSMQDAKKAQLAGGNWSKYPRNMLFARAISNAARWYAPEVITGCYTPDEMGDVEAIEATYTELPREVTTRPRSMPSHRAERTRDDHPTTMELDAPQTGQAPPTPPPGEAVPVRKSKDPNAHYHATCEDLGFSPDERRWLLGYPSTIKASDQEKDDLAYALKEWDEQEVEAARTFVNSESLDDLRVNFRKLTSRQKTALAQSKDYLKQVLSEVAA